MILTRFTCNGAGMFSAIGDLIEKDMPAAEEQEVFEAEEYFGIHLEVPDIFPKMCGKTKSYFTEEGLKAFEEQIDTISYYLDMYLGPVNVEKKFYSGAVLYEDPYQVVLAA